MLLLRLVTTALCATCVVLLARFQPVRLEVMSPGACGQRGPSWSPRDGRGDRPPTGAPINVVDVAPGVTPSQIAGLIRIAPDERILAVNDLAVRDLPEDADLAIGEALASLPPRSGAFLDLTVASDTAERRVLVLMH